MSTKIQDILNWYNKYNDTDLVIKTQTKNFYININNRQLPHLLGLQYATEMPLRGYRLYNFAKIKTDEEIYDLISENHPEKLENLKDRVENFQTFMKNLDKATLYEMTNPNTKIKSNYLFVKISDEKFLQMCIARDRADEDYLETFIVDKDNIYFMNSEIKEPIISIERYAEDGSLEPFSFSNLEYENIEYQYIETSMGRMPVQDYSEIIAIQYGFDSYKDMYDQGGRLGKGLDENPTPVDKHFLFFNKEEFHNILENIDYTLKAFEQSPAAISNYLAFKTNFYNYSDKNAFLIYMQNPYSTFVASFNKWKDLGYSVKKGEKPIRILRPIEKIKYVKDGKTLTVNKKTPSKDKAKIASGEYSSNPQIIYEQTMIYDISQTDCPPEDYPKIFSSRTGNADRAAVYECVKEYAQLTGFIVTEDDISSISLGGYYKSSDDTIHINNTLKDDRKLSVLCHELAHGMLHKTSDKPTAVKEFEAESFSAMLQSKLGFFPSETNKEYIKRNYFKAKDLINPQDTLKRTAKMFAAASSGITEIMKERGLIPENSRNINREEKITPSHAQDIKSNFMQAL